jgi:hypothetical protein
MPPAKETSPEWVCTAAVAVFDCAAKAVGIHDDAGPSRHKRKCGVKARDAYDEGCVVFFFLFIFEELFLRVMVLTTTLVVADAGEFIIYVDLFKGDIIDH